nr:Chain P, BETA-AMYLOID PROTEIN 42 [Homo sapiens]5AM8_Q Chain Q, BETA-AMYLOID PROTEIN 42 [Homo sapiens]5AM8_R Chain R, BETA-AMYLOID PROTEIN 42 [Homo sapiens]5AM8_S Chain S, BETA-AMYLOID PROTEIN 42 [Homo sapiens]
FRHDSGY